MFKRAEGYEALYDKYVYHRDWYMYVDDFPGATNLGNIVGHNQVHIIYMWVVTSKQKGYYCTTCDTFVLGDNMYDPPLDDGHPKEDRISLAEFREVNNITNPESFVKWIKTNREEVPSLPQLQEMQQDDHPLSERQEHCQVPGVNRHHYSYRGISPIHSLNITSDTDELATRLKDMYLSIAARDHRIEKLKCMLCNMEHELRKKGDLSGAADLNYALSHC